MTFWYTLSEFSRQHCIAICAFLVPANLLATLQTMLLVGTQSTARNQRIMVSVASLYAVLIGLHVYTWFSIGVVMPPTYILLFLSTVCLGINTWAIAHPMSLTYGMQTLFKFVQKLLINLPTVKRLNLENYPQKSFVSGWFNFPNLKTLIRRNLIKYQTTPDSNVKLM
ncbi:MAG: hypothetical protein WBA13_02765 [Microcoleaceae cyanobacterium]